MSRRYDQWIRKLDVPETRLHENGYTLYKISSTVFHREYPESSTCVHVWRRYSIVHRLYKKVMKLHSQYDIPGQPPKLAKPFLINRFDEAIIENRRKEIIEFLRYCAHHPAIFTSEPVTAFLKDTAEEKINVSKLQLDKKYRTTECDYLQEVEASDSTCNTDEVHSRSEPLSDEEHDCNVIFDVNEHVFTPTQKLDIESHVNLRLSETKELQDYEIKSGSSLHSSIYGNDSSSISWHGCDERGEIDSSFLPSINLNVDMASKKRNRSPLHHSKSLQDDLHLASNKGNRFFELTSEGSLLKRKTSEYLHRAEQLIARFSMRDLRIAPGKTLTSTLPRPCQQVVFSDPYLKNYKVIGVHGKVALALDVQTNETVAVKVIVKNGNESVADMSRPPCHVPFMVPLITYHEGESAIYLVLKFIRGGKLWDHLKSYISKISKPEMRDQAFPSYKGQRLIQEENEPSEVMEEISSSCAEQSLRENDDFNFNWNLAISECRSTMDNIRQPVPLSSFRKRLILSLTHLEPLHDDSLGAKPFTDSECAIPVKRFAFQSKSKSLTDLSSEKPVATTDHDIESTVLRECDNISLGSDTLSGVSDDFSCSSLTCAGETSHSLLSTPRDDCGKLTTGDKIPTKEYFDFDVSNLIKNSRKLLKNVDSTLERSKKQFSPKDSDTEISQVSMEPTISVSNGYNLSRFSLTNSNPLSFSTIVEKYAANHAYGIFLPESLLRVWMSQVIMGLESLHMQGFVWGNFNLANILLDDGGSIILTYYSDWVSPKQKRYYATTLMRPWQNPSFEDDWMNSCGYIAPELFSPLSSPSFASDWWSIGALFFHLLTGKDVASNHPCGITSHTQINMGSHVSPEAVSIVRNLLRVHPSERLGSSSVGAVEVKMHPFFNGIVWSS